jgi:hypothetical protein
VFVTVLSCAPEHFVPIGDELVDQATALREAFEDLQNGLRFARMKIKDGRKLLIVRELVEMSHEAYVAGDSQTGASVLQEAEAMIWKERRVPVRFAAEAERRAFGSSFSKPM